MPTIKESDFRGTMLKPYNFPRYEKCDLRLLQILDRMSRMIGTVPVITSSYRTAEENTAAGGAAGSYHLGGLAVDCLWPGVAPLTVVGTAESCGSVVGGLGLMWPSGAVHIDVRSGRARFGEIQRTVNGRVVKEYNHTLQEVLALFSPSPVNNQNTSTAVDSSSAVVPLASDSVRGMTTGAIVAAVVLVGAWLILR